VATLDLNASDQEDEMSAMTQELLRSFRVCGSCDTFQRLGDRADGGYLSCMDNMPSGSVRAAYSMGIEQHDLWSRHVQRAFHVPVYQFDCTVDRPATLCDGCEFYEVCLQGEGDAAPFVHKTGWTLGQAMYHTGQQASEERSLLMKMDIEGSEWATLRTTDLPTLRKFRQLFIEFHDLDQEHRHADFLATMRHLKKAGFQVVHTHGNDLSSFYEKGGFVIPTAIEVTLDSAAEEMALCKPDEEHLPEDHSNKKNPNKASGFPLAHLPAD